jgi:polyisoprenoid-binding protein YceI
MNAKSLPALLACLAVLGSADFARALAAEETYRVDAAQTTAGFAVSQLGIVRQRGHFDRAWGTIVIDPDGIAGSIDVVIDPASVDTGWSLRDRFLRGDDMLDVERYPVVRFRSTRLEYRGRRVVAAEGEITLHGVTRPLRLEVRRLACSRNPVDGRESCGATVTGQLLRRDFGIAYAWPIIGDDIDLDFVIKAFRVRDEGETEAP